MSCFPKCLLSRGSLKGDVPPVKVKFSTAVLADFNARDSNKIDEEVRKMKRTLMPLLAIF